MNDNARWWLNLPPCADCGRSHVLTDCNARLSWEVATAGDK
jgi:hypothetical protein